MAQNEIFDEITATGVTRGFKNMFFTEMGRLRRTRSWWLQTLLWVMFLNVFTLFPVIGLVAGEEGALDLPTGVSLEDFIINQFVFFYLIFGLFTIFGVIVIMQNIIVGEKKSGTAAWVLSKPVSRFAYINSKFLSNSFGILLSMIIIPGVIAFVEVLIFAVMIGWEGTILPINFLLGIGILAIHTMFYLTLVLMLGTLFDNSSYVLGISLAISLAIMFLSPMIGLAYLTPYPLTLPPGTDFLPIAGMMMLGESMDPIVLNGLLFDPIISIIITFVASIIFIVVAFWRFPKNEF
ncbi:MAG: ABC transporter permease [Promethearchaeota archaeon]